MNTVLTTVVTTTATELARTRCRALGRTAEVMVTEAASLAPAEDIVQRQARAIDEACMPGRLFTVDGSVTVVAGWQGDTAAGGRRSATTAQETRR